ncbi:hypothetical protein [Archaeoglobus sp.]
MDFNIFFIVFVAQFIFWLFLNFTQPGKIISAIWGSLTLLMFLTSFWYPNYLKAWELGFSGEIVAISNFMEDVITNSVYFLIQFVVPPWMGFLVGISLDNRNLHGGAF